VIHMVRCTEFCVAVVALTALSLVLSFYIFGCEMAVTCRFLSSSTMVILAGFIRMEFDPSKVIYGVLGAVPIVVTQFAGIVPCAIKLPPPTTISGPALTVTRIMLVRDFLAALRVLANPLSGTLMHTLFAQRIEAFCAVRFPAQFGIRLPLAALATNLPSFGLVKHMDSHQVGE